MQTGTGDTFYLLNCLKKELRVVLEAQRWFMSGLYI